MPRTMRVKSETDIYHVMLRGINQQIIFNEDEDFQRFLETLKDCKAISGYKVFAYCLMNNHVHLLIKTGKEELGQVLKRIGVRYVTYYNWKYFRRGHLFQDRYKSEPIEDDKYFLTVLRYIHQNPIKAGIVQLVEEYKHSSYHEYIGKSSNTITDINFAIDMLGKDEFIRFNNEANDDFCMDECGDNRISDEAGKRIIKEISNCEGVEQFIKLSVEEKEKYVRKIKEKGLSYRQICRLTGLSYGIVRRI